MTDRGAPGAGDEGGERALLRRMAKASAQIGSSNAAVSLLGLVTTVAFARALPPAVYGRGLACVLAVGLVVGWGGLGVEDFLTTDVARELGEGRDGAARRLMRQYAGIRVASALGIAAVLAVLQQRGGLSWAGGPSGLMGLAIVLLVVGQSLGSATDTAFLAHQRFAASAVSPAIAAAVRAAFALAALFAGAAGADGPAYVVLAYASGSLASELALLPKLWQLLARPVANAERGLRMREAVLRHGKWAILSNLVRRSADPAPELALTAIAGPAALALYRVGSRIVSAVQAPILVVAYVLGPVIASSLEGARSLATRVTKYSLALSVPLMAGAALLVHPVVRRAFPAYAGLETVVLVVLPSVASLGLRTGQRPLLYALRRQDLVLVSYVAVAAVELGLASAGAWAWGVTGFALVRMLATFGTFAFRQRQLTGLGYGIGASGILRLDDVDQSLARSAAARLRRSPLGRTLRRTG